MRIVNYQPNINIARACSFKGEASNGQASSMEELNIQPDKKQENTKKFSLPVLLTTITGVLIPILLIRKNQGLNIKKGTLKEMDFKTKAKSFLKSFDIKYEMPEMLMTAFGSVVGGLMGGLLFDKNKDKESKRSKIKESVFQLLNVSTPIIIGDQILKFADKKKWKSPWVQVATAIIAVGAGMPTAAKISNTINNKIIDREHPDNRKLRIKDAFVHVDDFVGVLVLSKVPLADKLHVERILPFLYGMCGYEAGTKQS